MQSLQPRISGTRDYVGADAAALRGVRDAIEGAMKAFAYATVEPPILEQSAPFLDRSGEEIRRRMYIFPDPGGRELCLRPEMTIPVCRAYLRQLQSSGTERHTDGHSGDDEARLCYVGPVFRYESTNEERYRQFYQAGAEFIGARDHEAADAEILALALDSVEASGLPAPHVEVGDLAILHSFIDGLPLADGPKTRLRRLALRHRKEAQFLAAVSAREAPEAGGTESRGASDFGELAAVLSSVAPDKAEALISQVLALADVKHVGGRTSEEIVERLMTRTAQRSAETISGELMDGILALLKIKGEPTRTFARVSEHFKTFCIASIGPVLDRCERRQALFDAYRSSQVDLDFNAGLGRGLEYYTGFVFEIFPPGKSQSGHVVGGGRYNDLLDALGAGRQIPAVGFGISLDRLLGTLRASGEASVASAPAPKALVVAGGASSREDGIRASTVLRGVGWPVETAASGQSVQSALSDALRRSIPYVVVVGEDGKSDHFCVKRLRDDADVLVDLAGLRAFAEGERDRQGGRS